MELSVDILLKNASEMISLARKTKSNHNQDYLVSLARENESNAGYIIISEHSHWIDIEMGKCLIVSTEQFLKIYEILGE